MTLTNPLQLQKQNLINQVSAEEVVRPAGFYKGIAIDALSVIAALVAGLLYRLFLYGTLSLTFVPIAFGIFLMFAVISMLLNPGLNRRLGVLAAQAVGLLLFFYDIEVRLLLPTAGALFLFFVWGDFLGQREIEQNLNIRFFKIARAQLKKLVTGIVIAGVVIAFPQWSAQDDFIPETSFEIMYDWSAGLFSRYYPDIRVNSTVEHFVESMTAHQLENDPTFQALPTTQKALIQEKTGEELLAKVSSMLKLTADVQRSLSTVFYEFLRSTMSEWQERYSTEFVIVMGVAVFLVLRGIATMFYMAVAAISFFVYQLLIAANIIAVLGETRTKEIIQYS